MRIIRNRKQANSFNLEGLTLGKLIAIQHALEKDPNRSSTGDDILDLLKRANVNEAESPDDVQVRMARP